MQLGARWGVGTPPHPSVPASLHEAIAAQEREYPEADSWTLTWLEGRPRCQLADGVIVTTGADGAVRILGASAAGPGDAESGAGSGPASDDDEDDDDWLS